MPHSFDGSTDSPASVEQIQAAMGRADYWLARVASDANTTSLDSLHVATDGTVTVRVTQHLGRQFLPGVVTNVMRGDLTVVNTETWTPDRDRQVSGQIITSVSGGLGSCRARTWLTAADSGSLLRFQGVVHVKIPLVGGALEKSIGANLAQNVPEVLRFTSEWIAKNA
jgi:hypothetical protein